MNKSKYLNKITNSITLPLLNNDTNLSYQEKINIFTNLLSTKSLDYEYILYYIFVLKGYITTTYNCFREFKIYEKLYGKHNFNLNLALEPDITFTIYNELQNEPKDSTTYNINKAHLNFISWLYYSGIYNFLLLTKDSQDIKYTILNKMNEEKLLKNSLFIKYQFFLIDYEEKLKSNLPPDTQLDTENQENQENQENPENPENQEDILTEDDTTDDSNDSTNTNFASNYNKDFLNEIGKTFQNIINSL